MTRLSKRSSWDWLPRKEDEEHEIHHIEWPWDNDDDSDPDYDDSEEGGADDYTSSRPWGLDNDGY